MDCFLLPVIWCICHHWWRRHTTRDRSNSKSITRWWINGSNEVSKFTWISNSNSSSSSCSRSIDKSSKWNTSCIYVCTDKNVTCSCTNWRNKCEHLSSNSNSVVCSRLSCHIKYRSTSEVCSKVNLHSEESSLVSTSNLICISFISNSESIFKTKSIDNIENHRIYNETNIIDISTVIDKLSLWITEYCW